MKNFILLIIIFALLNNIQAQPPWKLTRDFSLAFQSNYEDYKFVSQTKGNKTHWIGFDKNDPTTKVLEFETWGNIKDGLFHRIDSTNKASYSIFFEKGIAKKLYYKTVDSLLHTFSIDSNLLNGVHAVYYPNGKIKEYGFYKNNARIGEWTFFNSAGKVIAEGSYLGDYNRLLFDTQGHKLVTLNRYLDTVKIEHFGQKEYDSLRRKLKQDWGIAFPVQLYFETGVWKSYDDSGKLIKEEFYEKGNLIRTEMK